MRFDVYYPFRNKEGKLVPGVKPVPMEWSDIKARVLSSPEVRDLTARHRLGNPDAKIQLPSINFVGTSVKTRAKKYMIPTQLVMIDIDHCKDAAASWKEIVEAMGSDFLVDNIMVAHISPSGGIHIIFKAQPGYETLEENMKWLNDQFHFDQYGDYDEVVKDFSRVSFAFPIEDLLFENAQLLMNTDIELPGTLENADFDEESEDEAAAPEKGAAPKAKAAKKAKPTDVPIFNETETANYEKSVYKGTPLKAIIEKWVEYRGIPGPNEVHNYYNEMVKYFRNIMGNNKRQIFYLLPRFDHSEEECWSQVRSICKVNTLSKIDAPFYFWLKNNGFWRNDDRKMEEVLNEEEAPNPALTMPPLPPVIRELVDIAPDDFKVSAINALLPIMGTLCSYKQGMYYYDARYHTPSFFSIIYAPASTGKGFIERYVNLLFEKLKVRDYVQNAREGLYLEIINRKGQNEKSPENPNTSLRIMPVKNSETELLTKMKNNHGYHMFTFAAEMDSWAKGVKAAGGNKDDMLRIAWDNGTYGQAFRGTNTFKGEVALYWNVLISGTLPQIVAYYKNVENGLVSRCSFTTIYNQRFAKAPTWKPFGKKALDVIHNYMERCDRRTYTEPCTLLPADVDCVKADEFDKEIDWKFHFRERETVDMKWLKSTIDRWLDKSLERAALNVDDALDSFRKRVAVRGFRLGLICHSLWEKPTKEQLKSCIPFIKWWMDRDLESMMALWGAKYNAQQTDSPNVNHKGTFDQLENEFGKEDVYVVCTKLMIKTPVRAIISNWKKMGAIEKIGDNKYKKTKKYEKSVS